MEWSQQVPWQSNEQVEQDLVICRALVEIFSDEWPTEMAVWNRPDEIAEGAAIGERIIVGVRRLKARAELGGLGVPVDALEFRERVFAAEEIDHGIEGLGVAQI